MDLYVIRRPSAWANVAELEAAGAKSATIGNNEMSDRVRWIRSYGRQPEEQADHPERILVGRYADLERCPCPHAIGPSQRGVVLDEEDRQGDKEKSCPGEDALECGRSIVIGENDHNHHEVA